jgi:hypothetical protein
MEDETGHMVPYVWMGKNKNIQEDVPPFPFYSVRSKPCFRSFQCHDLLVAWPFLDLCL